MTAVKGELPPDKPEFQTAARYSFADQSIGREDFFVKHPSGKVRMLCYPDTASNKQLLLRENLIKENLLLGGLQPTGVDDRTITFRVPQAARPVIYDAESMSPGVFSYGDDRLFFDIGAVLGRVLHLGLYIDRDIGRNIALVEFTHSDEPNLFIVPGIELTPNLTVPDQPEGLYAQQLSQEFTGRFTAEAHTYFRMGFNDALRE